MEIPHVVDYVSFISRKPWLVMGKGPSLSRFNASLGERFHLFSLNQAALIARQVDIAHFTDFECWLGSVGVRASAYCLPWYPHWEHQPTKRPLPDFATFDPRLTWRTLLSYDLISAGERRNWPDRERVVAYAKSAEAAVHILALAGQKTIYTIGVDGGAERDARFSGSYVMQPWNQYDDQLPRLAAFESKYRLSLIKM